MWQRDAMTCDDIWRPSWKRVSPFWGASQLFRRRFLESKAPSYVLTCLVSFSWRTSNKVKFKGSHFSKSFPGFLSKPPRKGGCFILVSRYYPCKQNWLAILPLNLCERQERRSLDQKREICFSAAGSSSPA